MNRTKRTSKLLEMARLAPAGQHLEDALGMPAAEFRRKWRQLRRATGGRWFLLPGRPCSPEPRERKVRHRSPERTYAERRTERRGWPT